MDQKTVFSQMQQFGNEWLKLMSESTTRFTAALAEVEKFEKQGVAQAVTVHVEDWLSERQETSPLSPNVLQDGSATRPSRSWRRRSTRPTTISP